METVEVTKSCRNEFKDIIKMTKDRCNRNKKKKKKKKQKIITVKKVHKRSLPSKASLYHEESRKSKRLYSPLSVLYPIAVKTFPKSETNLFLCL
jgi:hypothetical protein